ncbi:MAG: D-3-phosphoglycerate dehydrogenase, partial [Armatimonadetes bacterium]|nr:D-3-phosphoglycerate dehydrogenase [Armatimonadota bacterium]
EPVASLEELLTRSEVLTIHAGWTTETTGIIDAARLALLPDGALLVNNARLPIVDEEALLVEVRAGRLRAALNLVPARPELYGAQDLAGLGNLMFTSGAVNVSDVYAGGMSRMLTDDLVRYARGEPLQQVVTPAWVERTT